VLEELEVSRTRYSELYDSAPVGYMSFNRDGVILTANLTAAAMLGVSRRHLLNKTFLPYMPDTANRTLFSSHLREALGKQTLTSCELVLKRKDGANFHVRLESSAGETMDNGKEEAAECRTAVIDITDLVKRDLELAGHREHLEELVIEKTAELTRANELLKQEIAVRKQAEKREQHLATFPLMNPSPVLEVDSSGKVIFFNPATREVLREAGLDENNAGAFLPPDLNRLLDEVAKKKKNRKDWYDYEVEVKDRFFGAAVYFIPIPKLTRIYLRDITKSREAMAALVRAKEEWERTFDSVPDLISILDNRHRIIRVNQAMARKLGLKPAECIGLPCYVSVHGLSSPPDFCPHSKTVADQCQHIEEVHEERLGGDFIVSTTPMYDDRGQFAGSVHVAHDITERKKAEEALRKSEERLRRFYEAGLVGVIYWNMDGFITDANDKFLEMLGYTRQEMLSGGIDWVGITPIEHRQLDKRSVEELMTTGVNAIPFEKEYIRKDGSRIPVLVAGAMLDEARNNGVAFVLDITERKKTEEEIRRHIEELERFNRAAVGRELRMIELKKEINELRKKTGEKPLYRIDFKEEA